MEGGRILYVRGTGGKISKQELTIYFQSRKQSGGGDISSIDLNGDEAVITFEDEDGTFYLHLFLVFQLFRCFLSTKLCPSFSFYQSVYILSVLDQGRIAGFTFSICLLYAVEDKQSSYRLVVFENRSFRITL